MLNWSSQPEHKQPAVLTAGCLLCTLHRILVAKHGTESCCLLQLTHVARDMVAHSALQRGLHRSGAGAESSRSAARNVPLQHTERNHSPCP